MAGDWIKMRTELRTHPKVVRMSSATGSDKLRVVGGLHSTWCLFDVHSTDGKLEGYSPADIDEHLGFPGFAAAMIAVGWLAFDEKGLQMPDFESHNGSSAKRRAEDSARKASERRRQSVRKVSGTDADKLRTREEKRREEKSKEDSVSAKPENVTPETVAEPVKPEPEPKPKREPKPKAEPKPRERDPLFDAIAEAAEVDPKTAGSHIGKIRKLLAEADPPYTPEDVATFKRDLWIHCSWARDQGRTRPELGEIGKWIGRIRAPAQPMPRPPGRGSPDDRTARLHAEGQRALEILANGLPDPFGINNYGTDANAS